MTTDFTIRMLKALLVLSAASLFSLAFLGNIFAYDINFVYMKHIMSMDDIPKHVYLYWRSVHNPFYFHVCYITIIALEGIVSLLLWFGIYHLLRNKTVQWCQIGLLAALTLYSLIFFTIGGEWFSSWQSAHWNAKAASTPFILLLGMTYLIVRE